MTQPSSSKSDTATAAGRSLAARMIDDVEVEIEAFVGGTRMTVADLGALKPQSV